MSDWLVEAPPFFLRSVRRRPLLALRVLRGFALGGISLLLIKRIMNYMIVVLFVLAIVALFLLKKVLMYQILLLCVAGMFIILYDSSEHMTNKDLLATLSTFGKTGIKKKTDPYEEEIYGPKVPKLEEEPTPATSKTKIDDGSDYPDIYGPEITPIPGQTPKKSKRSKHADKHTGKHISDDHMGGHHVGNDGDDDPYEFNPDLKKAFPMEDNEPQPFLTDFSKFQH
jgi:hypothetical protein